MSILRRLVLHRAWLPAVALITVAALVPRAVETARKMSRISRAAGVHAWDQAPTAAPGDESGVTRFRWTKARAVVREPVRGTVLTIPLYLGRPDPVSEPVTVQITIEGKLVEPVVLAANGWHIRSYDLTGLLGGARLNTGAAVSIVFVVSPIFVPARSGASSDPREIGVGVGDFRWTGPVPASGGGAGGG